MNERIVGRTEYQMMYKDKEGEAHIVDLEAKRFAEGEEREFTYLTQAAPTIIRPSRSKPRQRKNQVAVDFPDMQFGYRRHTDGSLEPIHDEQAMDVALQVTKDIQPDLIILGGDELDLPELSRFSPDSGHFVNTLQASIDGLHKYLAQLRADNPNARIVNLDSNHVRRIGNFMMKNAMPLFGVRRANMPDDWPVMSYANLLRLDDLEIEWNSGYPAAEYSINDRLGTFHGDKANSRNSTAAMYLQERARSLMFHHTHRAEQLTRTNHLGQMVTAFSFGCLTRTDGAVPSYGNSVNDRGEVVLHHENWQTGIGVVEYDEGDKPFQPHAVSIPPQDNYETVFNGRLYVPRNVR